MKKIERFLSNKRITIINKENGGLSSARNCGLKIAKGEYIVFVDSDDFIDEMMLEKLYENSENKDIVISNVIEYNNVTGEKKQREIKNEIKKYNKGSYFWKYSGFEVCNKIYKRSFLMENNIKFIEGIVLEDVPFNFYSLFLTNKVKYVDKAYYYYYRIKRENSILNTLNNEKILNAYNKINIKLHNFSEIDLNGAFSKLRVYIWKIYYISQEKKSKKEKLELTIITEFEERLKKNYKSLSLIEKEILKEDLRTILHNRMFWEIKIFDSFYWKNKIFTRKILRRIIEGKIKNIFKIK